MNRLRRSRSQAGFTMIELIIVVAIAGLVMIPMLGLLDTTYRRLPEVREANDTSQQLRVFRSSLITDWARGRIIRLNRTTTAEANRSLVPNRIDCGAGSYSHLRANVTPLFAINTHVSGNNNGLRIVYSQFRYTDQKTGEQVIDIIRRQCGHKPDISPFVQSAEPSYDYWGTCGQVNAFCRIPTDPALFTATLSERVVVRGVKEFRSYKSCNNLTTQPPYGPCDANLSVVGMDGQITTIRLYQQVLSTGRQLNFPVNQNFIALDLVSREP